MTKSNKRGRTSPILHIDANKTTYLKELNVDYVKTVTNSYLSTILDESSSDPLINFTNIMDTESNIFNNGKILFSNYIYKDNSSHRSSLEIIYREFYESDVNSDNTNE